MFIKNPDKKHQNKQNKNLTLFKKIIINTMKTNIINNRYGNTFPIQEKVNY